MTTYNKYITKEGKNEILKIAFSNQGNEHTFKYLALGTDSGQLASQTGDKSDFLEVEKTSNYHRVGTDNNTNESTVEFDGNGTATISFTVSEDNYNGDGVKIKEIALCNDAVAPITDETCKVFAFCEVPEIIKTGNISLKYTLKISIE